MTRTTRKVGGDDDNGKRSEHPKPKTTANHFFDPSARAMISDKDSPHSFTATVTRLPLACQLPEHHAATKCWREIALNGPVTPPTRTFHPTRTNPKMRAVGKTCGTDRGKVRKPTDLGGSMGDEWMQHYISEVVPDLFINRFRVRFL